MITLQEAAQNVVDALIKNPTRVSKEVHIASVVLREVLAQPEPKKVHLHEFLKAVEGKENFIGIPFVWAEWPTREEQ